MVIIKVTVSFLVVLLHLGAVADARVVPSKHKETKEYCSTDTFHVSCKEHEVIEMTSALYGRMQPGRCISGDYHHTVGCSTDVLAYMDSKCSGRRECNVVVGALELVAQPCQKDFKAYLEASYNCVPVVLSEPELCQSVKTIPTTPAGIAFGRPTLTSAGDASSSCAWDVSVDAGQQVSLVLSSYPEPIKMQAPSSNKDPAPVPVITKYECPWIAVIHEGDKVNKVELCASADREKLVYTSTSSQVIVSFVGNGDLNTLPYFLLKYKAVGCPDIEAPKRSWVKRDKDNLVMKCNDTGETWYLTCRHGEWIGDVGNCSQGNGAAPASRIYNQATIFQEGVIFAVIVGIFLGLLIGTSMLGIVFFCRKRWMINSQATMQGDGSQDLRPSTLKSSYPALLRQEKQISGNVCEYTHVWEVRPTNMTTFSKKDSEAQKVDDCYISAALSTVEGTTNAPGICTQSMMGSQGIYETSKARPCEKHAQQLCLKHDTPLYFELDSDGKRTCAV